MRAHQSLEADYTGHLRRDAGWQLGRGRELTSGGAVAQPVTLEADVERTLCRGRGSGEVNHHPVAGNPGHLQAIGFKL